MGLSVGGSTAEEQKSWDQPLIIAEPDVEVQHSCFLHKKYSLQYLQVTTLTDDDNFMVLACDGLYDVFTNDEVVSFVKAQMEEHGDCQKCCQNITNEAIKKRNSRDNVSVILIILNKWY